MFIVNLLEEEPTTAVVASPYDYSFNLKGYRNEKWERILLTKLGDMTLRSDLELSVFFFPCLDDGSVVVD